MLKIPNNISDFAQNNINNKQISNYKMPKWLSKLFTSSPHETCYTESYRRGYKNRWINELKTYTP
jgi:hypothetical protein